MCFWMIFCKRVVLLFLLFMVGCLELNAQSDLIVQYCGAEEVEKRLRETDPLYELREKEVRDMYLARKVKGNSSWKSSGGERVLPVVVHVVSPGSTDLLSIDDVQMGLKALNSAFAGQPVCSEDPLIDVSSGIQFCLANRDIFGNETDGIEYYESAALSNMTISAEELELKSIWGTLPGGFSSNPYPSSDYINVWLVQGIVADTEGVVGFAYRPGVVGAELDGIVLIAPYWYDTDCHLGKAAVHEMGHYLGLYHTFKSSPDCLEDNPATEGDLVEDTPVDTTDDPLATCGNLNGCGSTDIYADNNFMDYGQDECQHTFTPGQTELMSWALENYRFELLQSNGCTPFFDEGVDADLGDFVSPTSIVCEPILYPVIELCNINGIGGEILTSAVIQVEMTFYGNVLYSENTTWTGELAPQECIEVGLTSTTIPETSFIIQATIISVNGGDDVNQCNDVSVEMPFEFVVDACAEQTCCDEDCLAPLNLIPNGGFEETDPEDICPSGYNLNPIESYVSDWFQFEGSADVFNSCSNGSLDEPENFQGWQEPLEGETYAGIYCGVTSFEYLTVDLDEPLEVGETYCLSYFVSLSENSRFAVDRLGALFHTGNIVNLESPVGNLLVADPTLESPANQIISDVNGWTRVCGQFVAEEPANTLVLGSFTPPNEVNSIDLFDETNEDQTSAAYYYYDDITLRRIETDITFSWSSFTDTIVCAGQSAVISFITNAPNYTLVNISAGANGKPINSLPHAIQTLFEDTDFVLVLEDGDCERRIPFTVHVNPEPTLEWDQEISSCFGEDVIFEFATDADNIVLYEDGISTGTNITAPYHNLGAFEEKTCFTLLLENTETNCVRKESFCVILEECESTEPPTTGQGLCSRLHLEHMKQLARVPHHPIFNFTGQNQTVEAWFTVDSEFPDNLLIGKQKGIEGWSILLNADGQPYFRIGFTNYPAAPTADLRNGECFHLALVKSGNDYRFFIDGDFVGAFNAGANATSWSDLKIGFNLLGFIGTVDDVRYWNAARSQSEIQDGMDGVDPNSAGLVAYWNFDEGIGQEFYDISPNGFDGYLGVLPWSDVESEPSWSTEDLCVTCPVECRELYFEKNSYVSIPAHSDYNFNSFSQGLTIEAWIQANAYDGDAILPILSSRSVSQWSGYLFGLDQEGHLFFQRGALSYTAEGVADLRDNLCHHVAVTKKDKTLIFYVDGVEVGSHDSYASYPTLNDLRIGWDWKFEQNGQEGFNGEIDEVRIWDIYREGADIQETMTFANPSALGLVGYWKFDQGIGETAFDFSSNANDGILGSSDLNDDNDPIWVASSCACDASLGKISLHPSEKGNGHVISAYPNPMLDSDLNIELSLQESSIANISLFNSAGMLVRTICDDEHLSIGLTSWEIEVADLPEGIYFLQTQTNGAISVEKLLKL